MRVRFVSSCMGMKEKERAFADVAACRRSVQSLLAVELNDVLVVDFDWNLVALRKSCELSAELFIILLKIGKIECRVSEEVVLEELVLS